MSNRMLPKSPQQSRSKTAARKGTYQKQTARLEGRRDGTPLIFGWGRHLTRAQKSAIQHRTAYGFFALVLVAIVLVGAFGWLQQNVLIPNQTIASVNNTNLTQDSYRKLLAYNAQAQWNTLQGQLKQYNALQPKVQKNDAQAVNENQLLIPQIQASEGNFSQASITSVTAEQLSEDALIQQGAQQFEQQKHIPASTFAPSNAAVSKALADFKKAFPAGQTYQGFLSKNGLSNDDVRWAVSVNLRRDLMQTYLASTYTSSAQQAHIMRIELSTKADAQKYRDQIVKNHADWATIAKQDSLDASTKDSGGDMGWVSPGSADAALEMWALDPARKAGDISPVLKDTTGTYDVLKIVEVDSNRGVDSSRLSIAKQNALAHWLAAEKAQASNHLTTPNVDMVNATRNLPVQPNLSAQLPQVATPPASLQYPTGGLPTGGVPAVTGP